jgi:hypothetical protein
MKILRIQLHPFGGVVDRIVELHDGLNVIERPNEFGKSTLNNALWHALFTPSKLTPKKRELTIGRWFPKPSGDHVRVTLDFEAQGQRWTLQKCWGVGESSSLRSSDAAAIAEPTSVQEKLSQLLQRNEATWRNVLFVNQAQLNNTIDELKNNSAQIDDLEPLLAGVAAIPGDIAEDKLAKALDDRIEVHFSRWDINTGGPEKGKGIDNPWAKQIGPLLAAYYAMETVRKELDQVLAHEKKMDRINNDIRQIEESINADREFVDTGKNLRDGLAKREGLEEKVGRLTGEQSELWKVHSAWPGADQVIANTRQSIQQTTETIEAIDVELTNARKRASAEELKASHNRLVKARDAWQSAANKLQESKPIPPETLEELKSLAKKTEELRIQIAAQKLSVWLDSKSSVSVTCTRGANVPESVNLSPGAPWEGQAEGKITLELEDLSIKVASGTGDVQLLFSQLEQNKLRQEEILAGLELEDLAAVEVADKRHRGCFEEEKNTRVIYDVALQEKTENVWAAEIDALDALPSTRSVAVLEDERNKAVKRKADQEADIRHLQENIDDWTLQFTNSETLTSLIVSKAIELKRAEKELSSLPQLPEGFENLATYRAQLDDKMLKQEEAKETLSGLKQEHSAISATTPKRTTEELREELESRERKFQRQQETGKALLRIRTKLEEIVEKRGNEDSMRKVEIAIAGHFHDLTCGAYANVRLDGGTPVEVTGKHVLETALLSQGTLGSLAIATRLALAELYLDGMEGFMILDDPFTDMDPDRRIAAGRCLGKFAKRSQVLFFTCHPEHRRELEEHAGAKAPCING